MKHTKLFVFVALCLLVVLLSAALPTPVHAAPGDWACKTFGIGCEAKPVATTTTTTTTCDWKCQWTKAFSSTAPAVAPAVQPASGVSSPFTTGNSKTNDAYDSAAAYRACTAANPGVLGAIACLGK